MSDYQKFRCKAGLSAYALACGYLQKATYDDGEREITVTLWYEGACYHVRAHEHEAPGNTARGRIEWVSEANLTDARDQYRRIIKELFGKEIAAVKRDKRYAVTYEFDGSLNRWAARFCREWFDTQCCELNAWVSVAAYESRRQHAIAGAVGAAL